METSINQYSTSQHMIPTMAGSRTYVGPAYHDSQQLVTNPSFAPFNGKGFHHYDTMTQLLPLIRDRSRSTYWPNDSALLSASSNMLVAGPSSEYASFNMLPLNVPLPSSANLFDAHTPLDISSLWAQSANDSSTLSVTRGLRMSCR